MANNLSQEGYEKALIELGKGTNKNKKDKSKEEIGNEWKRLQSFMQGKK